MIGRWAKRSVCALAWAGALASSVGAQNRLGTNAPVAGGYQLEGVREVGAELRLHPDGRFEFDMAYGGADLAAHGRWVSKGGIVELITDALPAAGFTLNRSRTIAPNEDDQHPDQPTVLVVDVKTPRLGLVWSNMAVVAEFSNGQSRSGLTGRNGMLRFVARTEPEWKGAYVRRISVAYPKAKIAAVSFPLDSRATRSISIDFEPGNLAPPAFERASLAQRGDIAGAALVQQSLAGPGQAGWKFVRR